MFVVFASKSWFCRVVVIFIHVLCFVFSFLFLCVFVSLFFDSSVGHDNACP